MNTWQFQEAKNKLSALVDQALHDGPQLITRHGKPAVVVMSAEEHAKTHGKPKKSFIEFLMSMPKSGDDEDLFVRIDGLARDVEF